MMIFYIFKQNGTRIQKIYVNGSANMMGNTIINYMASQVGHSRIHLSVPRKKKHLSPLTRKKWVIQHHYLLSRRKRTNLQILFRVQLQKSMRIIKKRKNHPLLQINIHVEKKIHKTKNINEHKIIMIHK